MTKDNFVIVGSIAGAYGVQGWVKVYSYTEPATNILNYVPWYLERDGRWLPIEVVSGRAHGNTVVAQLKDCNDRDAASTLSRTAIAVKREQLPATGPGEYYWVDMIGLRVVNQQGVDLGVVKELFATGANDVLVVEGDRERLIPYVKDVIVLDVNLADGVMRVDWEADY